MADLDLDEDAIVAAADLIGRTGARGFESGYLHDGVPIAQAGWWAAAHYRGTRITVEDHIGPVEAATALAERLLSGGQCQHCGGIVSLSPDGVMAHNSTLVDGRRFTIEQAAAAGLCHWRRIGPRWVRGCEDRPANPLVRPHGRNYD